MRTIVLSTAMIASFVWMGIAPADAAPPSMSGIGKTNIRAATVKNIGYRRRYHRRYGYQVPYIYPPAYGYYVPPYAYVYPPPMHYALPPEGDYVDGPPPEGDYGNAPPPEGDYGGEGDYTDAPPPESY